MKTCRRSPQNVVEEPSFRMQASAVKQLFFQIINVFEFEFSLFTKLTTSVIVK